MCDIAELKTGNFPPALAHVALFYVCVFEINLVCVCVSLCVCMRPRCASAARQPTNSTPATPVTLASAVVAHSFRPNRFSVKSVSLNLRVCVCASRFASLVDTSGILSRQHNNRGKQQRTQITAQTRAHTPPDV